MEKLQGKHSLTILNLPNDVELLDIKYDLASGQVLAIVRSDSFDDVAETYPIPEFRTNVAADAKTAPKPATSIKTEINRSIRVKPELSPTRKALVQQKQNSNKSLMEEEFTPEQRKLLSFSVDGEFIVIKPIKFLKAEWDDINEVVRSLGGRWVKGDIISYWEIPIQQT